MRPDPVEAMLPAAAALAVAVADYDRDAVAQVLTDLTQRELHALAIALAANVDLDEPLLCDPIPLTPDSIATRAVNLAANLFGTTPMDILSTTRDRATLDARAVAMYACYLAGLSSPATGSRFNRDHSTVLHACGRVGENARLRQLGQRIAAQCGWRREQDEEAS